VNTIQGSGRAAGFRFAVVVAKYNDFVTDRLQAGALAALAAAGVAPSDITLVRVPGAFEIPLAALHAAESGRFDAIVCLGCLIRGETAHFEYIAAAASQGLMAASAATGVPMTFGILTTDSAEQALARAGSGPTNKGWESAVAAVEMARLFRTLARPASGGSQA
jgi:6,7-dimethyl-8-ribityllumazine synthase